MKPINNFPGYEVSKRGEVWSAKRKKFLKPWLRKGYFLVKLCCGGREKSLSVHRLVLETFVGPCPKGSEGLHLNGNSLDNRLLNLKWGTPKENARHKFDHKSMPSKLKQKDLKTIRKMAKTNSQHAIARHFGVNQSTISRVVRGNIWIGVGV